MNITDKDIEDLVRHLRVRSNETSPYDARHPVLMVTYAIEDWLSDIRRRSEELVKQILGQDDDAA